jgi:hypothetical protein
MARSCSIARIQRENAGLRKTNGSTPCENRVFALPVNNVGKRLADAAEVEKSSPFAAASLGRPRDLDAPLRREQTARRLDVLRAFLNCGLFPDRQSQARYQSWAELAGRRNRRLQRRRKVRHPLSEQSGEVAVWEMDGSNIMARPKVENPRPGWQAIGASAGSDILLQNTSGQTMIWEMAGGTVVGGGLVNPNPGSSWHAIGLT